MILTKTQSWPLQKRDRVKIFWYKRSPDPSKNVTGSRLYQNIIYLLECFYFNSSDSLSLNFRYENRSCITFSDDISLIVYGCVLSFIFFLCVTLLSLIVWDSLIISLISFLSIFELFWIVLAFFLTIFELLVSALKFSLSISGSLLVRGSFLTVLFSLIVWGSLLIVSKSLLVLFYLIAWDSLIILLISFLIIFEVFWIILASFLSIFLAISNCFSFFSKNI